MFATFYNGKTGNGLGYRGELNGIDVITLRPSNRESWIQIRDTGGELEIKKYHNHEFEDAGDLSHIDQLSNYCKCDQRQHGYLTTLRGNICSLCGKVRQD